MKNVNVDFDVNLNLNATVGSGVDSLASLGTGATPDCDSAIDFRHEQRQRSRRGSRSGSGRRLRLGFLFILVACDNGGTTPDWSRMITQPKVLPFSGTPMRHPPAGTIQRDWQPDTTTDATATIPVPITRELLGRGRERFAIACAPCHGVHGDGDSVVAHAMQRRRPPSFADRRLVALTPGKMFEVVTNGYGLMPSYSTLLDPADRWAVIAFVRTLQLADGARVAREP